MRKNIFTVLAIVITAVALVTACSAPGTTTPGGTTVAWAENGGIKIAYVTSTGATDAISSALVADAAFDVLVVPITDCAAVCGQADMVVCSESPQTSSQVAALQALEGLGKPMLFNKVHAYKTAVWDWTSSTTAYGNSGSGVTSLTVVDASHVIFTGLGLNNGDLVQILTGSGTNGITYMDPASFSNLGNVAPEFAVKTLAQISAAQVPILEIPVGQSVNGTSITQRFIQIGINSDSYSYLSATGLQIIKNACYYLAGETVPTPGSGTITINLTGAGVQQGHNLYAATASPLAGGVAAIAVDGTASFVFVNGVPANQSYINGTYPVNAYIDVNDNVVMDTGDYQYTGTVTVNGNTILGLAYSSFAEILPSSEKAITAFSFEAANNPALAAGVTGTINETAHTIAVSVPAGTSVTALVATFAISDDATIYVGTDEQVSGTTSNDFTGDVTYTVRAEDTSTQDYIVTVTVATAPGGSWTGANLEIFGTSGSAPSGSINASDVTSITITSTGGNVSSTNRRHFYAYKQVAVGDFRLTARIASVSGDTSNAGNAYRFGMLITTNIATAATYADSGAFASIEFYYGATGLIGSRTLLKTDGTQNRSDATLAVGDWIRIIIKDEGILKRIIRYTSTDGATWTQLNSTTDYRATSDNDSWYYGFYGAPGTNEVSIAFDNILMEEGIF